MRIAQRPRHLRKQARGVADFLGVDKMTRYSHATVLHGTRCTVEMRGARFCDGERAKDMPFPICAPHALELYRRMHEMVTEARANPRDHLETHAKVVSQYHDERYAKANSPSHQVYYVQIGERIKIGTTKDLRQRLSAYPPGSQLLAVEKGGEDLESRRLQQFRHLLADRKEWFHPGPDLLDHIARLTA